MKFVLITQDPEVEQAARDGFVPYECLVFADWAEALEAAEGADMMFVDFLATLKEPHKVEGYEDFAQAKMSHPIAAGIPLVLVSAPRDYEIDFMTGWPDFLVGNIPRPVDPKVFRRASTWA